MHLVPPTISKNNMAEPPEPQVYAFTPVEALPPNMGWPQQFPLYKNSWLRWEELETMSHTTLIDLSHSATARILDGVVTNPPQYTLDPSAGYGLHFKTFAVEGLGTFEQLRGPVVG
jgi:hypothetical protein